MMLFFWLAELAYFMLPAYVANMAPVLSRFVHWNIPLNKKLLGSHKTVVGTLFGLIGAVLMAFVQSRFAFYPNWLLLGLLLGSGALLGDIFKSFVKRQLKMKPGQPWIPFDEIDFSVGALIAVSFVYFPGWLESVIIIVISALGHTAVNHVAFYLGIRGEKW